jgi:hypothetical protein
VLFSVHAILWLMAAHHVERALGFAAGECEHADRFAAGAWNDGMMRMKATHNTYTNTNTLDK